MSINDFSESASLKFLFEMLDGKNGALQEIRCSVTHWSGAVVLAMDWY